MKMEFTMATPRDGVIEDVRCGAGKPVGAGQTVFAFGTPRWA
jgi:biotin carboxyl carrier protein